MDTHIIFPAIFLLCLIHGGYQLTITEFSVPNAAQSGESVELKCRYSVDSKSEKGLFVKWWWTPIDATDQSSSVQLYQRIVGYQAQIIPTHTKLFHIELKEDDSILLLEVNPKNSGTFECEVSDVDEVRKHQQLIVYTKGSGPHVNVSLVEEDSEEGMQKLTVECEASDVSPMPSLSIAINGEVLNTTEIVSDPEDGLYSVFANATVMAAADAGAELRCELFYDDKDISHPAYIDTFVYTPAGAVTTAPADAANATDDPRGADIESILDIPNQSSNRCDAIWLLLASAMMITIALSIS